VPSRFVPSGVLLLSAGAVVLFAPVVRADSTSPSASVTRPVVYTVWVFTIHVGRGF